MSNPTGSDLAAALALKGIEVLDPGSLDPIMALAVKDYEQATGFNPFLAAPSVSERTFGLNVSNVLYLKSGIATLSGLIVSVDDSALTIGTDYWAVKPCDGLPDWPYTQIKFGFLLDTNPDVISVVGRWGFETELNPIAKDGMIKKGMAEFLRDVQNGVQSSAGSTSSIKQGEVDIEFKVTGEGQGLYDGSLQKQCANAFNRAVSIYQAPWKVMA